MTESEPRVLILVGISGTGKTTLTRDLMEKDHYGVVPGLFTRDYRADELKAENRRISDSEFDQLSRKNRLLWDIHAGYGTRYGIDTADIDLALKDTGRQYAKALIPEAALAFAEYCGHQTVRTMFIPAPPTDVLRQRMLQRGDDLASVQRRLDNEDSADWLARVSMDGIVYVSSSKSIAGLRQEALTLMSS